MAQINNLPEILNRMGICSEARDNILLHFGHSPRITQKNLRKAAHFRGFWRFLDFARIWLNIDDSLDNWLWNKADKIRRKPPKGVPSWEANEIAERMVADAIWAYWQEMQKP